MFCCCIGVPLDSPLEGHSLSEYLQHLASITPGLARSYLFHFIFYPAAADPADSSSFFDDLASQIPQSPTAKGVSPAPSPRGPAPGGLHPEEPEFQPGKAEASILRALYAANYSAAVDACLQVWPRICIFSHAGLVCGQPFCCC